LKQHSERTDVNASKLLEVLVGVAKRCREGSTLLVLTNRRFISQTLEPCFFSNGSMSEQSSVICLPVLVEIKTAQAQHGLKHGDYQRYRQYCTRKLHRLRESVNLKCGKKSFQPKPIDEHVLSNERCACGHDSSPLSGKVFITYN
jgi:hypothetical protein